MIVKVERTIRVNKENEGKAFFLMDIDDREKKFWECPTGRTTVDAIWAELKDVKGRINENRLKQLLDGHGVHDLDDRGRRVGPPTVPPKKGGGQGRGGRGPQ